MAVCLVTGGAGFLGSHLVDALVARGDTVKVLDNFSSGSMENLDHAKDGIEIIAADINDKVGLKRAVRGVDFVFHFMVPKLGGMRGPATTPGKWAFATDTIKVLMAAREARVRRLLFASSGDVYGVGRGPELKESDPMLPDSLQGFAKQTGENQCAGFTMLYGLETVRLRFFNVFGPRQPLRPPSAAAIPTILMTMLAERSPEIDGNPFQQHDFLYVVDAIHATLLAAESKRASGKVFNIARGRTSSLVQVVHAANHILHTGIKPILSETRTPSQLVRSISIVHAEAELGFCPSNDLAQGLSRFIGYLQRHGQVGCRGSAEPGQTGFNVTRFSNGDRPNSARIAAHPADQGNGNVT